MNAKENRGLPLITPLIPPHIVGSFLALFVAALVSTKAFACEQLNATFYTEGRVLDSNNADYLGGKSEVNLALILGVYYFDKAATASNIRALRLTIDDKERLTIIYQLEGGLAGREFQYDVSCIDGQWVYSKLNEGSSEGTYRNIDTTTRLLSLPNGDIEIQRASTDMQGILFKHVISSLVVARFKKMSDKGSGSN